MHLRPPIVIYLDYNVFVFLLDGRLPALRSRLDELRESGRVVIPYTREHVVEAMRGIDDSSVMALRERAAFLLDGISALSGDAYIYEDMRTGRLTITRWSPQEVYEVTCPLVGTHIEPIGDPAFDAALGLANQHLQQQMRTAYSMYARILDQLQAEGIEVADLRTRLGTLTRDEPPVQPAVEELMRIMFDATARAMGRLDKFGLNPHDLNNVPVANLRSAVDARLQLAGSPLDLDRLMACVHQYADTLGDHPIATYLGMLGSLGYNRDKASTGADSRISDLGHANLGLRGDVFVTDDRRLRNRAIVTAHELGLSVRVAALHDANAVIDELVHSITT